jgi:hypothetical protein
MRKEINRCSIINSSLNLYAQLFMTLCVYMVRTRKENHMSLPDVAQAQAFKSLMASPLRVYRPDSIAVMDCSTGNGFGHIDPYHARRASGIGHSTAIGK